MNIPSQCCTDTDVSMIKFEEGASKATIRNSERKTYSKIAIDGCMVKNEVAADGALYDINNRALIIELKGVDVSYGAHQVLAAAALLKGCDRTPTAFAGIVIGKQFPKVTSGIQKAQNAFAKQFKGPLHVVTKNGEFDYDAVFSFRGPHRI